MAVGYIFTSACNITVKLTTQASGFC